MNKYFLGMDIGSSKSHAVIANSSGQVLGFGFSGGGNPDTVGYDGMGRILHTILAEALTEAGISQQQISGAGFGISGYDWPQQEAPILEIISTLKLNAPIAIVNDAVLGILAGTKEGWGLAVVSGTGCNAWGWNKDHSRVGHVTGGGVQMGEFAGASELIYRSVQAVSHEWTLRGPATQLSTHFVDHCGANDLPDLLYGLIQETYQLKADAAPLVFQAAHERDKVALDLIGWAGIELGEMAKAVIRQLAFENETFDIVLIGSMFNGSSLLSDIMQETVKAFAPNARLVRLEAPPVMGALLLGMETVGFTLSAQTRTQLREKLSKALLDRITYD